MGSWLTQCLSWDVHQCDKFNVGSPLDFTPSGASGLATLRLPTSLSNFTVSVHILYINISATLDVQFSRDVKILRAVPVTIDEKKCLQEYEDSAEHLCYLYSDVLWGSTSEEGSFHSIEGFIYPMEIQHYFFRSNLTHSLSPLAVSVLFKQMEEMPSHITKESYEEFLNNTQEMYPKYMKDKTTFALPLGKFLPNNLAGASFYQYRGSPPGTCQEWKDWIVFEEPLIVFPAFLTFLESLGAEDDINHFPMDPVDNCFFYSEYSSAPRWRDHGVCAHLSGKLTEAKELKSYVADHFTQNGITLDVLDTSHLKPATSRSAIYQEVGVILRESGDVVPENADTFELAGVSEEHMTVEFTTLNNRDAASAVAIALVDVREEQSNEEEEIPLKEDHPTEGSSEIVIPEGHLVLPVSDDSCVAIPAVTTETEIDETGSTPMDDNLRVTHTSTIQNDLMGDEFTEGIFSEDAANESSILTTPGAQYVGSSSFFTTSSSSMLHSINLVLILFLYFRT